MNQEQKHLVKMLRGENMGINLYEKYVSKLNSHTYKKEAEGFLKEHRRHKARLENIMESRGMEPFDSVGIQGNITEIFQGLKLTVKNKPDDVMRDIYKGEVMAVNCTQRYMEEFSESIRADIEKMAKENKERIEKIHQLLMKM